MYDSWRARLQLYSGDDRTAQLTASDAADRVRHVKVPESEAQARNIAANILRQTLVTQSIAQLRLGQYAEVEKASVERAGLPPNSFSGADPRDDVSRARVMQAHAVAMQGRRDEARRVVSPELQYLRAEQAQGAAGVSFQRDLAYALYVDAISQPDTIAGRAMRRTELDEAARLIAGLSIEARQFVDVRYVNDFIAAARSSSTS
jgi:hypothetical protein